MVKVCSVSAKLDDMGNFGISMDMIGLVFIMIWNILVEDIYSVFLWMNEINIYKCYLCRMPEMLLDQHWCSVEAGMSWYLHPFHSDKATYSFLFHFMILKKSFSLTHCIMNEYIHICI